jgi:hypothetical protein
MKVDNAESPRSSGVQRHLHLSLRFVPAVGGITTTATAKPSRAAKAQREALGLTMIAGREFPEMIVRPGDTSQSSLDENLQSLRGENHGNPYFVTRSRK